MAQNSDSLKAVLTALGANAGIAVIKTGTALFTGSGAMLAEALHSFADCGNQVLLLVGMRQAKKPATEAHPMAYGREAYFWSLMVALLLFTVGGLFSMYHGIHALTHPVEIQFPAASLFVLMVAMALEGVALRNALKVVDAERGDQTLWQWFKDTRQSELMVVVGEDVAALSGLVLAFVALTLTAITGNPLYDALGTIAVGALLVLVAAVVLFEVKSLIAGESVSKKLRDELAAFIQAQPEVDLLVNMITQQFGAYMMVAVKVRMKRFDSDVAMVAAISEVEERMQRRFTSPKLTYIFFEPDLG